METKQCTTCHVVFDATTEHFNKHKNGKYGLASKCKPCAKKIRKEYTSRPEVRAKLNDAQARYRSNNLEKARETVRKCYSKNADKYNAYKRNKRANDPEFRAKCIARDKAYSDAGKRLKANKTKEQWDRVLELAKKSRSTPERKVQISKYNKKSRAKNREWLLAYEENRRKHLTDGYLAHVISQNTKRSMGDSILSKDVTPELIEIKRKQLKLHRHVKRS